MRQFSLVSRKHAIPFSLRSIICVRFLIDWNMLHMPWFKGNYHIQTYLSSFQLYYLTLLYFCNWVTNEFDYLDWFKVFVRNFGVKSMWKVASKLHATSRFHCGVKRVTHSYAVIPFCKRCGLYVADLLVEHFKTRCMFSTWSYKRILHQPNFPMIS